MCGRYTLSRPDRLPEVFEISKVHIPPRFNIAPTQEVPVVCWQEGKRFLHWMRWGLVPSWTKEFPPASRLINARSETIWSRPAFREAARARRCLIPADGFYEWKRTGKGAQPYFFSFSDQQPFGFAGLWDVWDGAGAPLYSCTILTCPAGPAVAPIHDRMPVILHREDYHTWLVPEADAAGLRSLLLRPRQEGLSGYPVSRKVNHPAYDAPDCVVPLDPD